MITYASWSWTKGLLKVAENEELPLREQDQRTEACLAPFNINNKTPLSSLL